MIQTIQRHLIWSTSTSKRWKVSIKSNRIIALNNSLIISVTKHLSWVRRSHPWLPPLMSNKPITMAMAKVETCRRVWMSKKSSRGRIKRKWRSRSESCSRSKRRKMTNNWSKEEAPRQENLKRWQVTMSIAIESSSKMGSAYTSQVMSILLSSSSSLMTEVVNMSSNICGRWMVGK